MESTSDCDLSGTLLSACGSIRSDVGCEENKVMLGASAGWRIDAGMSSELWIIEVRLVISTSGFFAISSLMVEVNSVENTTFCSEWLIDSGTLLSFCSSLDCK